MSTVIDLALVSPVLVDMGMRDTFMVSFDEASFSDHAVLSWSLNLQGVSLDPLSPPVRNYTQIPNIQGVQASPRLAPPSTDYPPTEDRSPTADS